jgi:UDP-2-acetamido-3-amino-2,3-dideoxy-glucuronate N-acetyltransferase
MVGNPARRIGWMCECGVRMDLEGEEAECPACGLKYEQEKGVMLRGEK